MPIRETPRRKGESRNTLKGYLREGVVELFEKRQINDATGAEVIAEEASRPTTRFVEPKSLRQQAQAMVFGTSVLFVRQMTPYIDIDFCYIPYALDGRILATAARTIEHFRPWTSLAPAAINGPK